MPKLFWDLTEATEQMIRQVLTVSSPITVEDMQIRELAARRVLDVWSETLVFYLDKRGHIANLNAERERLQELANELAAALPGKDAE